MISIRVRLMIFGSKRSPDIDNTHRQGDLNAHFINLVING